MTPEDELERSEVEAVLETRRELGLRYDRELVDGFADRIEAEVRRRVGDEVRIRDQAHRVHSSAGPRQLALGIVSMVAGIPITAINLAAAGLQGVRDVDRRDSAPRDDETGDRRTVGRR